MRSLSALLLVFCLATPAAAEPVDDVKESFLTYKTAILEADGAAAAKVVTQNSRDYFRDLADQALTLDRAGLHDIHLTDRLYAMLLRHKLDRSRLQQMSGGEVVSYAVDNGWIGRNGASQLRLGHYEIEGDHANGTILRPDGLKSPFRMEFVKEDGRWLLDLVALMKLTRTAFEYAVQQSGLSEDEFVLLMLEQGTGVKPGPEIWSPPS
ncbi:hypothetical protein [Pelagibius marinus]|uniref:hypothetical protein n=1 Tax=Pelagibius marinus TaxID=2762760 RepID=UPI0018730EB1|nr:hypothetical protein [Pelagibius marinus]